MRLLTRTLALFLALAPCGAAPAHAQRAAAPPPQGAAIDGTVAVEIVTGEISGTFAQIGADLTALLEPAGVRVVPLLTKGSLQNVRDLLNLRGVDLALCATDAVTYGEAHGLYPPNARAQMVLIAKLYDNTMHVLAGPGIHALSDLAGKTVNVDVVGSGTSVTAVTVLDALHIKATLTNDPPDTALTKLEHGDIAALVYDVGKPGRMLTVIPASAGLHLVPVPASDALLQIYLPATFTHEDYPALVPEGATVDTLGVPVLLVAYNWNGTRNPDRWRNLSLFTQAFFQRFPQLLHAPPYNKNWQEVNLAATVPGWTRAAYATAALAALTPPAPVEVRTELGADQFQAWLDGLHLAAPPDPAARTALLTLWKAAQPPPKRP